MSVPVVAKFRRLLDSLPRETLPDVVTSMIRTSNKEKLQVKQLLYTQTTVYMRYSPANAKLMSRPHMNSAGPGRSEFGGAF